MKYRKASDVLPENLLQEVQKYAAGETLYFPKDKERIKWGEKTGARDYFRERNDEIRQKYFQKMSIETIRKIVFK